MNDIAVDDPSIPASIALLRETGFVVIPNFVPSSDLVALNEAARTQLLAHAQPVEFEVDLRYPGAPASRSTVGGETVRRLLDAYGRDPTFAHWATLPRVRRWMESYFGEDAAMSRAHHNCLMTKHPLYGSLTGWHRDIRYWSFQREDLVSVWIALGVEEVDNGALWFVPGSHRSTFGAERFDREKFFLTDRADNEAIVDTRVSPKLAPGDAVFFHCNTLHSAGKNTGNHVKFSLVYTYHGRSNRPTPGSRSSSKPEVELR